MSSKLQNLPAATSLASTDVVYTVTDPSGSPVDNKITVTNLKTSLGLTGTNTGDQDLSALALKASPTFTGTVVLPSGQALIAPALGTPASGVMTSVTGTASGLTAGNATQASALKSATTTVNVASATAPTSGQVLTATGASTATWQTPSAGATTPTLKVSTIFETLTRFTGVNNGTGSDRNIDSGGLNLATGTSTLGYSYNVLAFPQGGSGLTQSGSPTLSSQFTIFQGTDSWFFFGMGNVGDIGTGTGDGYTGKHIGFKITRAGSGAITLYATQADGTTETATSMGTLTSGNEYDLILKVNGTSSVDYYYRESGGALSSATNISTNMPTGAIGGSLFHYIKNKTVTSNSTAVITSLSYER